MDWWLIPVAYLIGSLSFSLVVVSLLKGGDLRQQGSGNAGATNVLRVAGKGPAALTLALDVAKGAVPVWIGLRVGASHAIIGATALAVVCGHVYPIFHGFRGGKGVATAAGALAMLQPTVLLVSIATFLVVVGLTRYVSLGSVLGVSAFPVTLAFGLWLGWFEGSAWVVWTSAAMAALIVLKHRPNLERLRGGTESRLAAGETRR